MSQAIEPWFVVWYNTVYSVQVLSLQLSVILMNNILKPYLEIKARN